MKALALSCLRRFAARTQLAYLEWALREIDPFHPDRHHVEGHAARLRRGAAR
jgi:hypothetical protein